MKFNDYWNEIKSGDLKINQQEWLRLFDEYGEDVDESQLTPTLK